MKTVKEMLETAPEGQLDPSMLPIIKEWDNESTSIQILEVLDKCIFASLASGFVISLLQDLYDRALSCEGKRHEDNIPLATWRKDQ